MTVWQIWWIGLALKVFLLPIFPMTPDEAYYFAWARHPALSYFDHPPFIAWIMTLAMPLWKTPLGIRLPGVILGHLSYLPWIFILKKLGFSPRAQIFWILFLVLGPLTGLGGVLITPDVPLALFWSLGLWAFLWTMESPSVWRWTLLGAIFGLGLLSKYSMILFVPAAFIWMYMEKKTSEFKRAGIWVGALAALLVFSPVLIWNFQNHFASFAFQTKHGLTSAHVKWGWPLDYLGTQLGLLNPFFALVALWVIWNNPHRQKLLLVFAAVPFIFFFLTSFRARVEGNWPVCAYPSFLALAASVIDHPMERQKWETWIKWGLKLSTVFIAIVISHTIRPWLPIKKDHDHTEIMREWVIDIPAVKDYQPLYARSYQMAAFHSYYRPKEKEVFKLAGLDRTDFYDFLKESTPQSKSYIIIKSDDHFPENLRGKYRLENPKVLPSQLVLYELIPQS